MRARRRGQGRRALLALCVLGVLGAGVASLVTVDFDDEEATEADGLTDGVAGPAAPPDVTPDVTADVTQAHNGGEVEVLRSQSFVVHLKGSPDSSWTLPRSEAESLARVATSQAPDGSASATFVPLELAPAVPVSAERVPACRQDDPPCASPTERFEVTIRVVG